MLRFMTAGESHGKCLIGILEGLPSGLPVDIEYVNLQLHRRQLGYGRGGRMKIEKDQVEITSGVRQGLTLGSPVSYIIHNKDWAQWQIPMSAERISGDAQIPPVVRPRPGHADLPGALKYQTHDIRDVLERASARETAARVAAGAICRLFLMQFGIRIGSHVIAIGSEKISDKFSGINSEEILKIDSESSLHCADPDAEKRMIALIDEAKKAGDTLGGVIETVSAAVPAGLGSHIQWDRRLDGQIAQAMMSIPSAKAVEIGSGITGAGMFGSAVHDEIFYDSKSRRFFRNTNRAGGLEGGISNGSDIRVRVYLKPIPTLTKPLVSVDIQTKKAFEAAVERGDTCVVAAAGVIAESMLGIVLAGAFLDKFGGDSMQETQANFNNFIRMLDNY
jgi:chorismate synthase